MAGKSSDDDIADLIGDAGSGGDGRKLKPTDNITQETAQTVAASQLRSFIERVERLEEDKKAVADDIKEVYAEMKGNGFDTKAVRTIIRMRKKDQAERQEEEAIIDLYKAALGMI